MSSESEQVIFVSQMEKCVFCGAGADSLYSIGGEAEKESSFNYNPFDREKIWCICLCCGRRQPLFSTGTHELKITCVSKASWQELKNEVVLPLEEKDHGQVLILEHGNIARYISISVKNGYVNCGGEVFELIRLPVLVKRYYPVPSSQTPIIEEMTVTIEIVCKGTK